MIKTEDMFHAGIPTFMGSDYIGLEKVSKYDIGVIGVPLDFGSSYRTGSKYGPRVIREYSAWDRVDGMEYYDYNTKSPIKSNAFKIGDLGDISIWPGDYKASQTSIIEVVEKIRQNAFPLILGGDHSITYGAYIGCKKGFDKGGRIGLLHFDAHNDVEDKCLTLPEIWHGNVFRKLIEEQHLNPKNMLSIGIRGIVNKKWYDYAVAKEIKIMTANDVNSTPVSETIKEIHNFFKECDGIYVSFDIDSLDITLSQGTGVPKYGGLRAEDVVEILRSLRALNTVGFDLVEVNPKYDTNGSTVFLACELLYNFLAFGLKVKK